MNYATGVIQAIFVCEKMFTARPVITPLDKHLYQLYLYAIIVYTPLYCKMYFLQNSKTFSGANKMWLYPTRVEYSIDRGIEALPTMQKMMLCSHQ